MNTDNKQYVVGVDIGGQSAKIGVVNINGEVINQTVISTKYDKDEAALFFDSLCKAISELVDINDVKGIGIGAPCANYYTGEMKGAYNVKWVNEGTVNLRDEVSSRLNNLPVTVTNDANAAAMGEMKYGAAKGMTNFIIITLGTGVGSGIVINGDVVYGHNGFAGELGHITSERNGRACTCGKKGCLETYTSATGVSLTAHEIIDNSDKATLLRNIKGEITAKDVFDAAEQGDEIAIEIFNNTAIRLGEALADFVHFSSPEAIVLFGGLTKAKKYILKPIEDSMNDNVMPNLRNSVKILISSLNESDAAILGASALAW